MIENKLKVVFYSNFLNHHQLPFCIAMYNILGDNFKFVATAKIPQERLDLGYENMNDKYDFVVREYLEDENELAINLAKTSDIIIYGQAPVKYFDLALENSKLVYRYSERIFKKGLYKALNPIEYLFRLIKYRKGSKKAYLLAASAYATLDYSLLFAYKNRSFKWGYFPEIKEIDIKRIIEDKNSQETIEILWVGRLIDWKNPKDAISLAQKLKNLNYDFRLKIVGEGPLKTELIKKIDNLGLNDKVEIVGSLPAKKVRKLMLKTNIFIFTSNFGEGWGAVLNEAMSSGCAIVASHAIGSVPFLLNKENGLIYKNEDINDLTNKVENLIKDSDLRFNLSINAYKTIIHCWNVDIAVNRLLKFSLAILNNKQIYYETGPMSKANIVNQNMKKW